MSRLFGQYAELTPEKREAAIADDYQAVFGSDRGQRVLADILTMASCFEAILSTDRVNRDMIDGKRELALSIFERAGFARADLPEAMIRNSLNSIRRMTDEPNTDAAGKLDAGLVPEFERPIDAVPERDRDDIAGD